MATSKPPRNSSCRVVVVATVTSTFGCPASSGAGRWSGGVVGRPSPAPEGAFHCSPSIDTTDESASVPIYGPTAGPCMTTDLAPQNLNPSGWGFLFDSRRTSARTDAQKTWHIDRPRLRYGYFACARMACPIRVRSIAFQSHEIPRPASCEGTA
jgi:hypothetical protein